MKNLLSFDSNGSRKKNSAFHSHALSHNCSGSAFTHVHKLESAQSTEISKNTPCTSEHINIGHSAHASSTLSALPLNSYTNAMVPFSPVLHFIQNDNFHCNDSDYFNRQEHVFNAFISLFTVAFDHCASSFAMLAMQFSLVTDSVV
ncbi:Pesticidal crystal protein Cry1Hb [Trichinella spiralis]|uniref:Pesticidal crystal protein Cry1Hb n=1 Tax=Trichinella spiralis TaxID=6334 RepID=A0ABR3KNY0_TRISP